MEKGFQTDVVITWVDGEDPVHRAKRQAWMTGAREDQFDDIAGETRFRQIGEVALCVASVLRFARFVRRIFIVTDNQDPHLGDFIACNFPDNPVPIEIVDHTVLFRGYEHFLPVFNSLAIETMLWRIPGLSEHFIYLNDDVVFLSEVQQDDFFDSKGRPICPVTPYLTVFARALRALKPRRNGHKTFGFKDSMLNAEKELGYRILFGRMDHTPHALRKSFFEDFFETHPAVMERNIRHKFRHEEQYNPQALFYGAMLRKKEGIVVKPGDKLLYIKPKGRKYIEKKLKAAENTTCKFCCINSLDTAPQADQAAVFNWLSRRLHINCSSLQK